MNDEGAVLDSINAIQQLPGGLCFAHGVYKELQCPKWPRCIVDPQIFKPDPLVSVEKLTSQQIFGEIMSKLIEVQGWINDSVTMIKDLRLSEIRDELGLPKSSTEILNKIKEMKKEGQDYVQDLEGRLKKIEKTIQELEDRAQQLERKFS